MLPKEFSSFEYPMHGDSFVYTLAHPPLQGEVKLQRGNIPYAQVALYRFEDQRLLMIGNRNIFTFWSAPKGELKRMGITSFDPHKDTDRLYMFVEFDESKPVITLLHQTGPSEMIEVEDGLVCNGEQATAVFMENNSVVTIADPPYPGWFPVRMIRKENPSRMEIDVTGAHVEQVRYKQRIDTTHLVKYLTHAAPSDETWRYNVADELIKNRSQIIEKV